MTVFNLEGSAKGSVERLRGNDPSALAQTRRDTTTVSHRASHDAAGKDKPISDGEIFRRLIRSVRRQAWLALLVATGGTAITILTVASLEPKYSATTMLSIDNVGTNISQTGSALSQQEREAISVDNEIEIMKSSFFIEKIIDKLDSEADSGFKSSSRDVPGILTSIFGAVVPALKKAVNSLAERESSETYKQSTSDVSQVDLAEQSEAYSKALAMRALQQITVIRRRGMTNIVAIEVTTGDPKEAAKLANTYAETYIQEKTRSKVQAAEYAETVLSKRVNDLSGALKQAEAQIKAFSLLQTSQVDDGSSRRELDQLRSSIATAVRVVETLAVRLKEAEARLTAHDYAALGETLDIPRLALLEARRRHLSQEAESGQADELRQLELKRQLDSVNARLNVLVNEKINTIRQQKSTSEAYIESLRKELVHRLQEKDVSIQDGATLFRLQQETSTTRQLYQDYLGRLKAVAQQRATVAPDAQIIAPANPPAFKSSPPRALLVLIGTGLSVFISLGLTYARDNYPRSINTVDELESASTAQSVGAIPAVRKSWRQHRTAPEDEVIHATHSEFARAIHRLLTVVELGPGQKREIRSMLVTSAYSNEGKTTISISLARAAAEFGLKVLLVDCNINSPMIHTKLGLENKIGFAQVLADPGQHSLASATQIDPISAALVMAAGDCVDSSTHKISCFSNFEKFIQDIGKDFDLIILDASSIHSDVHSLIMAPHVNAVLVIARCGEVRRDGIVNAIDQLTRVRDDGIKTVLNFATLQ